MPYHADDRLDWNLIAMTAERRTREAQAWLGGFGKVRNARFPRVLVAKVDSLDAVLDALKDTDIAHAPFQRLAPVVHSVPFLHDDVVETLCLEMEEEAATLAGRSFFVRASLRGMKGRLETPVVERALGGFLSERAAAVGEEPQVTFRDPDVVVSVEVVGARLGYAFLERGLRAHPFVRVR